MTAHVDTFARDHLPPRSAWPDLLFTLPELRYPDQVNAAAVLLGEPRFAERACVVGEGGTWTYAELRSRAEAVAVALVDEEGLVPGNRVLLHGPNTPELIACWFGILLAGGVVVATMPLLRAGELAKVIAKAQVSHAIADARVAGEVRRAAEAEPVLRSVREYASGEQLFPVVTASKRSRRPPRTSRSSPSPPVPPASRRAASTSIASCWPPATPSARGSCARGRTTCSPGRRRSRSRSASA